MNTISPIGTDPRRRGGVLKSVIVALVVLGAVGVLGWVLFLPALVKRQIASSSGFPSEAERIKVNPFGGTVYVAGFHLLNPEQFPTRAFVDMELLDMQVRPMSFFGDRMEIPRLHIAIEKVTLVTNKDGVSNASLFKQRVMGAEEPGAEEPEKKFHVGELVVRIGSIEVLDYSKGAEPVRHAFPLNVNRRFTDVTDPKQVAAPIVADVLRANVTGLTTDLAALLPPDYANAFSDALRRAGPVLQDAEKLWQQNGNKAVDAAKKLLDSLQQNGNP